MVTLRRTRRSGTAQPGPDPEAAAQPSSAGSAVRRRGRLLALLVGVTVAAAAAGWVAGLGISTPTDAARDSGPPEPSVITAPVERRVLTSTIVTRGDARFSASTELTVEPGLDPETAGRPVVTGRLPRAGSQLAEGDVAVEVSGRPVLLLGGDLPMYRGLGPGTAGADVEQLEHALARLGFPPGRLDDTFDDATARAVRAWYESAGYQPVGQSDQDQERLTTAEAAVRAARDVVDDAQAALAIASRGPSRTELVSAEGEVAIAQEELDNAIAGRDEALAAAAPEDRERVRREQDLLVLRAEHQLAVARAQLDDLTSPPDTTVEQAAADRAEDALAAARTSLDRLRANLGTTVPRSEVLFLPDLPRRVEQVQVRVGDEPTGPVLTLSGADLQVVTSVTAAEQPLVSVGDQVQLDEETLGIDLTGRVVAVSETADEEGTHPVRIRPAGAGADTEQLVGTNVRVTIPIESTDGAVLVVPVAAVATAADGTSRVRVLLPDGTTRDVAVRVGLSADGYLEVSPSEDSLRPGDEVVLGLP